MNKYQNVSDATQVVVGIGVVEAGGIIETDKDIDNPNFELVSQSDAPAPVTGTVAPQASAVTEITPAPEEPEA